MKPTRSAPAREPRPLQLIPVLDRQWRVGRVTDPRSASGPHAGNMLIPVLRVFLVSPVICLVVGACFCAVAIAVLGSWSVADSGWETMRTAPKILHSVPRLMFNSLWFAAPFGIGGGVLGATMVTLLGYDRLRGASRTRWVRAGLCVGGVAGLVIAAYMAQFGISTFDIVLFSSADGLAGMTAGAALGLLGWWEFGSRTYAPLSAKRR
jgi:hypothetical protein